MVISVLDLQAEFFGLLGLADKTSAALEQHPQRALGNEAGPSSSAASIEFDSVYVETGFHPIKSEFDSLQQQQAATMQVLFHAVPPCNHIHTCDMNWLLMHALTSCVICMLRLQCP